MMKERDLKSLVGLLVRSSNSAVTKHGVHYYEHERNGQWRPCPESFAVRSAFESVREAGYGVAAEAHQGGIWILGGCKGAIPEGGFRRRYDLAIWAKGSLCRKPIALCEFKWLFGKEGFQRDADNLALAKKSVGTEAILCLLVAHGCRERVLQIADARRKLLAKRHDIRLEESSRIQAGKVFRYGRETGEPPVYMRATAFCLR